MGFLVTQFGHLAQAAAPKQGQVDCRSQSHQALVGANVGSGAFALDVLFAGGQRQHIGTLAAVIHCLTDQAASHLVDILLAGGEKTQVRSAERKRDSQRLALASNNIRTHLAGCFKQAQGDRVGNHADQGALRVGCFDQCCEIIDAPEEIRVLDDDQGGVVVDQGRSGIR